MSGREAREASRAPALVGAKLLVLVQPLRDCGWRHVAVGFLLETRSGVSERVAGIIVGESGEDHAQRVGLVAQSCGSGREGALACEATPKLDDLDLLAPGALAADMASAAIRAALWALSGVRNPRDPWRCCGHISERADVTTAGEVVKSPSLKAK